MLTMLDQKVVLDSDLARVYSVTTKRLNEQLRRNRKRFPQDFAFQLSAEEYESLRSQFATLDKGTSGSELKRSQTATLKAWARPAPEISPMGIYRTRRPSSSKYTPKRTCHRDERLRHPRLYRSTRKSRGKRRDLETPGRNRSNAVGTRHGSARYLPTTPAASCASAGTSALANRISFCVIGGSPNAFELCGRKLRPVQPLLNCSRDR